MVARSGQHSRQRARRSLIALVSATVVLAVALPLRAAIPIAEINAPADVLNPASRVEGLPGLVSVSQSAVMTTAVIESTKDAARTVGALAAESSGYGIGMAWVRRGDQVVQQPNVGAGLWMYPMHVSILPVEALASLMGSEVEAAVANGTVTLAQTSADLRGARAGDTIGLVADGGAIVPFTIGFVAPDAIVGGAEIIMSPAMAATLGADLVTSVVIYGQFSRFALDAALFERNLVDGTFVRVRRSWDARSPDSTLGVLRTKVLLGEFAYRLTDTGLAIDPAWSGTKLPPDRILFDFIPVRARCHVAINADIQAALTEIHHAGLSFAIDLTNTNTHGGCYNPRFNRLTGNLGSISRHSWAQAIDMNTVTNAQGRRPQMDCRVVRIFRKHNFAWGGNFLTPDGMHFEWVGEPRNGLQYPSEYCPNVASGGIETLVEPPSLRDTFFEGEWPLVHDEH